MRTAKRVIAATALGLPLLFGAQGAALADGGHHAHKPPQHKEVQDQALGQDQDNSTKQTNTNTPTTNVWNVGKGDVSTLNWNNQENKNDTDQTQGGFQEQEDE